MTPEAIVSFVATQIQAVIDGHGGEYAKLDFKRSWYDLSDVRGINEFLKDTSAMANSPGLDGFIIIGFDEKAATYHQAVFRDSQLTDETQLSNLINRHVDRSYQLNHYPVTIDENQLSVLHIPASFDKPHVIRNYKSKSGNEEQHRVFVKNGSATRIATKYDLDYIAFDRANHVPEYDLQMSFSFPSLYAFYSTVDEVINIRLNLLAENTGRRAVGIHTIKLSFPEIAPYFTFTSVSRAGNIHNNLLAVSNVIIAPGQMIMIEQLTCKSDIKLQQSGVQSISQLIDMSTIVAQVGLTNGEELSVQVRIVR